jgi:hypothetical protein
MSSPHDDDREPRTQRQVPKNRFRVLFIGTVLLIIVVIFGYMLLVGGLNN